MVFVNSQKGKKTRILTSMRTVRSSDRRERKIAVQKYFQFLFLFKENIYSFLTHASLGFPTPSSQF